MNEMDLDLERRMCMDLMRGGMDVCGEGNALFSLFAGVNKERGVEIPISELVSEFTSELWEQSINRTCVSFD